MIYKTNEMNYKHSKCYDEYLRKLIRPYHTTVFYGCAEKVMIKNHVIFLENEWKYFYEIKE